MRRILVGNSSSGFTLVELLVTMPALILVLGSLVTTLVMLYSNNTRSLTYSDMTHETQNALGAIADDTTLATAFLSTKDANFTDPYGPNGTGGAWNFAGSSTTRRTLILRSFASDDNLLTANRSVVYINKFGCDPSLASLNPALPTNIIFFIQNNNLYRRTLTDTTQTTCSTMYQQHSCPAGLTTPNAICRTTDSLILKDIDTFDISYYRKSHDTTALGVYDGSVQLDAATTIRINIKTKRNNLIYSSNATITRLN